MNLKPIRAVAALLLVDCGGQASIASSGSTTGEVSGTVVNRYFGESGPPVDVPMDVSTTAFIAYVRQAGGWATFPGTGKADGTFVVPGVPPGPFLLRMVLYGLGDGVHGGAYVLTEARTLDLGTEMGGRPDAVYGPVGDQIAGAMQNLAPWQENDSVTWVNINGGGYGLDVGPHAAGTTSSTGAAPWTGALVDAKKGDVLHAYQMSPDTMGHHSIVRHATFTGLEQKDGLTAVTGTFVDVAPTESLTVDFRGSELAAALAAINPSTQGSWAKLYVLTRPGASQAVEIAGGGAPDETLLSFDAIEPTNVKLSAAYGNPFPAAWGSVLRAGVETSTSAVYVTLPLEEAIAGPIQPRVTPVQNLLIAGQDAFGAPTGTTLEPVITWDPPALGTPSGYGVDVYGTEPNPQGPLASIVTTGTRVTIPPDVLTAGMPYKVNVFAFVSPIDATTKPWRTGASLALASVVSNVATP